MAPEQLMGKPRPASDQDPLAVVFYEWLSGDPLFSGSVQQIASQQLSAPPPSLRTKVPTIPPAVEQVVLKALAKDPQQRYANVQAFAMALEEAFNAELPGGGSTYFRGTRATIKVPTPLHSTPAPTGDSPARMEGSALRSLPTETVTVLFPSIEGSTPLTQQFCTPHANELASR